jgi:hypothetical protein
VCYKLYYNNGNPTGDNLAICSKRALSNPRRESRTIRFQKLRDIVISELNDTINFSVKALKCDDSVENLVQAYISSLQSVLDVVAPERTKVVILRPACLGTLVN